MSADRTIQDVFNRFYPAYTKTHELSAAQRKAAYHIRNCKTGAFGINVSVCEECGCISIHYNSCRDRCCPMCQEFPKEKWVDARREDVLDAPYFHVVFTVPEELNPVIYSNQKLLYDALYHASSDTLRELASDSKYLGADIGYICILHTWGSEMNFHPHIHAVVLGGGLDPKNHWKDNGEDFFLPIRVVSRLFRGKYLAAELEETKSLNEQLQRLQLETELRDKESLRAVKSEDVQTTSTFGADKPDTIELTGATSDTVMLYIPNLLYIESVGNYVKVVQLREGAVVTDMLRATSHQMADRLHIYPMIVRFHRAFIVNLQQVDKIISQSGSMQLLIKHCEDMLPVSRSNMQGVKKAIAHANK